MDREEVIKGLKRFKADFKPFCGNNADWKRVDDTITLLKELESERLEWIGAVARLIAENELLKEQEAETELCDRCGRRRLKSKWEGR